MMLLASVAVSLLFPSTVLSFSPDSDLFYNITFELIGDCEIGSSALLITKKVGIDCPASRSFCNRKAHNWKLYDI